MMTSEFFINLCQTFHAQLREHVARGETKTSLEFVPVIAKTSGDYFVYRYFFSTVLFLLLLLVSFTAYMFGWVADFPYKTAVAAALLTSFGFYFLSSSRHVLRFLVPRAVFLEHVSRAARLAFLRFEVFQTKSRTGILIYISMLEHAVYVYADKGVIQKVPQAYWAELGAKLAQDFSHNSPGDSFVSAIDELLKVHGKEFPPCADNQNELSDELRRVEYVD